MYAKQVDIILFDKNRPKPHFFAGSKNHHSLKLCAKITLLTARAARRAADVWPVLAAGPADCTGRRPCQQNFFKKGIDFVGQTRYNVKLYENNEKGDATHAQH